MHFLSIDHHQLQYVFAVDVFRSSACSLSPSLPDLRYLVLLCVYHLLVARHIMGACKVGSQGAPRPCLCCHHEPIPWDCSVCCNVNVNVNVNVVRSSQSCASHRRSATTFLHCSQNGFDAVTTRPPRAPVKYHPPVSSSRERERILVAGSVSLARPAFLTTRVILRLCRCFLGRG